ncbi:OmcA/MtrC family decaheme c-type cytochrome [Shewanella zhangzhouensis]|uniref:OmcA/MtrC family decaheme c-type cytochrome n=1 Tax=Shewanella zhangzhouensis TaxID=2864213 RepID=UPI001C65ABA7|nr:OmcA/MtrC family decaheme c-type cytochrome [Shewanella zhangzhouensis]QYK03896.1 OmcA/MtrC family decaheme c-type cytochrome [Shewanella zhangzhouensis]
MMKNYNRSLLTIALLSALTLTACGDGKDGQDGAPGTPGTPGTPGEPGKPGTPAGSFVTSADKAVDVTFEILPADINVAGSGDFAIKFKAMGKNAQGSSVPFSGLDMVSLYSMTLAANSSGSGAPLEWVNNAMVQDLGSSMYCTLTGTYSSRGQTGNACTLVEDADEPGTYTGTWTHDGAAPIMNPNDDLNATHRLFLRAYNVKDSGGTTLADKVLSDRLDYVPATGAIVEATGKDTVTDAACISCHGNVDGRIAKIEAHHNYQSVENCIACHNPDNQPDEDQLAEGWLFDFGPMIHRLHAGHHISDFLSGEAKEYFGELGFPGELRECTSCHNNGPSWSNNLYRQACVGCHINVNFETGEGHSDFDLAQSDDTQCKSCHASGALSPAMAHKVGKRAEYAELFKIEPQTATVSDPVVDDGQKTLTVSAKITMNGAPVADGTVLTDYMTSTTRPLLIGNVNSGGFVNGNLNLRLTDNAVLSGGVLTVSKAFPEASLTGTVYVTAEVQVCADKGMVVKCRDGAGAAIEGLDFGADHGLANAAPLTYFNLDDPSGATVAARMDTPARITVEEAKCNSCHQNLTHVKGTHGVTEFTQCMNCHNTLAGTSGHPVQYDTGEVDVDGNRVFETITDITFNNRDLITVAHRFHSGNWDARRGVPAIYLDKNMELQGYPGVATDCSACHKDGAQFFANDGGLTSGKRAIKVSTSAEEYITPVAEACRTCHAHSDGAALAHFKSNGAYVQGEPATTSNLPVESCATCHAEGKAYGIDKVHAEASH